MPGGVRMAEMVTGLCASWGRIWNAPSYFELRSGFAGPGGNSEKPANFQDSIRSIATVCLDEPNDEGTAALEVSSSTHTLFEAGSRKFLDKLEFAPKSKEKQNLQTRKTMYCYVATCSSLFWSSQSIKKSKRKGCENGSEFKFGRK